MVQRRRTCFQPPPCLAKRVQLSVRRASHPDRTLRASPWRPLAVAASLALLVAAGLGLVRVLPTRSVDAFLTQGEFVTHEKLTFSGSDCSLCETNGGRRGTKADLDLRVGAQPPLAVSQSGENRICHPILIRSSKRPDEDLGSCPVFFMGRRPVHRASTAGRLTTGRLPGTSLVQSPDANDLDRPDAEIILPGLGDS